MAEAEELIGWELDWSEPGVPNTRRGSEATIGTLTVRVHGEKVWGPGDGEWPWIELVEWLIRSWPWLNAEDGAPLEWFSSLQSLSVLPSVMSFSTRNDSPALTEKAEQDLWDFRQTHDMSRALVGGWSPAIVVWREGLLGHILTDDAHVTGSWHELIDSLNRVGDRIVERLSAMSNPDERVQAVVAGWADRDTLDATQWLAVVTNEQLGDEAASFVQSHWDGIVSDGLERSPVLAAARMSSWVSGEVTKKVLACVDSLEHTSTPGLDKVTTDVAAAAELDVDAAPFEQAYAFANAFRQVVGLDENKPFEPERWLKEHGVLVDDVSLGSIAIDAIAAWGPRNGPAVLVNRDGRHSSSTGGRNASLAHEIGHLLMDRDSALPAAEVLGGRVSEVVEKRARAFAAEILMARSFAGAQFSPLTTEDDADATMRLLARTFRVSNEVIAWQVRNSGSPLHADVRAYLRAVVTFPERY